MMNSHPDPVTGRGFLDLEFATDDGAAALLAAVPVILVPTSKYNLLPSSLPGVSAVTFAGDSARVTLASGAVSTVHRSGGLFLLSARPRPNHTALTASLTVSPPPTKTLQQLHATLGHLAVTSIHRLVRDGVIKIPDPATRTAVLATTSLQCLHCPVASLPVAPKDKLQTHLPSPGGASPLGLYSTDVVAIGVPSLSGALYASAWLCHTTKWVLLAFHRTKGDAAPWFMANCGVVAATTGVPIRVLRSDNGGEYTSAVFTEFLEKIGIARQFTSPHSSFQNGAVERYFRTLRSKAGAALSASGLPPAFWAEAFNYVNHVWNRLPRVGGPSPYEAVTGSSPSLAGAHPFGCLAFAKQHDPSKSSLTGRARPSVYLGPALATKDGHRVLHLDTGRVTVTRTAQFVADSFPRNPTGAPTDHRFDRDPSWAEVVAPVPSTAQSAGPAALPPASAGSAPPAPVADAPPLGDVQIPAHVMAQLAPRAVPPPAVGAPPLRLPAPPVPPRSSSRVTAAPAAYDPSAYRAQRLHDVIHQAAIAMANVAVTPPPPGYVEPRSAKAALASREAPRWVEALRSELKSQVENGTYSHVAQLPPGRTAIPSRFVFKIKLDADGRVDKFKARLTAKGFMQKSGLDYSETFSATLRFTTFRLWAADSHARGFARLQLDAVTAFLVPRVEEEIFMRFPDYEELKSVLPELVPAGPYVRLEKGLPGLKQSGRIWFRHLDNTLKDIGFTPSTADPCLYTKVVAGAIVATVAVMVDDLAIAAPAGDLPTIKKQLCSVYKMTDKGPLNFFLGVNVLAAGNLLHLSQHSAITQLLRDYGFSGASPVSTPAEGTLERSRDLTEEERKYMADKPFAPLIGSLLYLLFTRADISFAVCRLTRYMSAPLPSHWLAALRVLRYLAGTGDFGLTFTNSCSPHPTVVGYADADYAGDLDSRRSTTGFVFTYAGSAISWKTKLQRTVALSTCEAELMALAHACQEAQWLIRMTTDLQHPDSGPLTIHEDNQPAIANVKDQRFSDRTKHMDIRYFYTRDLVELKVIDVKYCPTDKMLADFFTKALARVTFERLRTLLAILPAPLHK